MRGGFRRAVGSVAAGSLVLLATVMVDVGQAVAVACGQVITTDTVLTADVGPCASNGIVIGADGIKLDLNGHTVRGTPGQGDGAGVLVKDRTGVRVTGGAVSGFDAGVAIWGGSGNRVTGMRVVDNIGSSQELWGHGIVVLGSNGNTLSSNILVNNGPFAGIAVLGGDNPSPNNTIFANQVLNHRALDPGDPSFGSVDQIPFNSGIVIGFGQQFNRVEFNVVVNSLVHGIVTGFFATDNVLAGNTVHRNGFHQQNPINAAGHGLVLSPASNRNQVDNNTAVANAGSGIRIQGGTSLSNPNNVVRFNRAFGNNPAGVDFNADLIDITGPEPCDNNFYQGNVAGTFKPPCVMAP